MPSSLSNYRDKGMASNSVCWNDEGHVVSCAGGVVKVLDSDLHTDLITLKEKFETIFIANLESGYVLLLSEAGQDGNHHEYKVILLDNDLTFCKVVHRDYVLANREGQSSLCVTTNPCTSEIIVLQSETVFVHDKDGDLLYSAKVDFNSRSSPFVFGATPFGFLEAEGDNSRHVNHMHALKDDAIILCSTKTQSLWKFKVEEQKVTFVRFNGQVKQPVSVSSDATGYIYVASNKDNSIVVLSKDLGDILCRLTSPQLSVPTISDISVQGEMLAVACKTDGLKLYRLNRMNSDRRQATSFVQPALIAGGMFQVT